MRWPSAEERFWSHVDVRGPDDCWPWTGSLDTWGYGALRVAGRSVGAHRFSWSLVNGPIPDGMHVLHECDVSNCENPSHLFLGTHAENMADRDAKGRQYRPIGEANTQAKLNASDVAMIRAAYARGGVSQGQLARQYGVSQTTVCTAISGRTWRSVA